MSALDTLKTMKVSLPFVSDSNTARQRIGVCRSCPQYSCGTCRECGCILLVKTRLAAEKCPLKKW